MSRKSKEQDLYDKWYDLLIKYKPSSWMYDYQDPDHNPENTKRLRKKWIAKCNDVIDILKDNANDEELYNFSKFVATVLDAEKYWLSIPKAYEDLNIAEIFNNYIS